ncbi:Protein O-glucosyltransferase 2 [Mactra antiquata]
MEVDLQKTKVWGPGLKADFFVPVRYFFIQAVSPDGNNITQSIGDPGFMVTMTSRGKSRVRVYINALDRKDGLYIIRYRLFEKENDLKISVMYKDQHVADSPYEMEGQAYPDSCNCPYPNVKKWLDFMECPKSFKQIKNDLSIFKDIDLDYSSKEVIKRYNISTAHSLSYYKIIDNQIYRKTYGQHVGFKMFSDAILMSLTKKVRLPDLEFFVNLGDWPLEQKNRVKDPVPIFSWCGSDGSYDIIMPTYDITESTLEMLGRQSLDVFSVMGNSPAPWENKTEMGFWRGRDSRRERLDLVVMSREHPDVIDAKLTRMFFFEHSEEKYGELVKNIPFYDFFKYKYQINIDGTVAAYRFPYLLAGDGVVLKQDSNYYEHFYKELKPYVHYIPFKSDLSDLLEKIQWVKDNDEKAREISKNGQNYVLDRLTPKDILCYHVKLFQEYSKRYKSPPTPPNDSWERVDIPENHASCQCHRKTSSKKSKVNKDEL